MSEVRQYLLSVTAAALLCGFISELLSDGRTKKTVSFLGSIILVLTVISPIVSLENVDIEKSISSFLLESEAARTGIEVNTRELQSMLIKENVQAYIQDRANDLGISVTVEVQIQEDGQVPTLNQITVYGILSHDQQEILRNVISQELGIPEERQEWVTD